MFHHGRCCFLAEGVQGFFGRGGVVERIPRSLSPDKWFLVSRILRYLFAVLGCMPCPRDRLVLVCHRNYVHSLRCLLIFLKEYSACRELKQLNLGVPQSVDCLIPQHQVYILVHSLEPFAAPITLHVQVLNELYHSQPGHATRDMNTRIALLAHLFCVLPRSIAFTAYGCCVVTFALPLGCWVLAKPSRAEAPH